MWLFPWLSYVTLAMLAGFVVLMLFDSDARTQLISTCVLFLVIAGLSVLNARRRRADAWRPRVRLAQRAVESPVDRERGAGDERRLLAQQERDERRDLLRLGDAVHRVQCRDLRHRLVGGAIDPRESGVSTPPVVMALTRTPRSATSSATARVSPTTACLAAT